MSLPGCTFVSFCSGSKLKAWDRCESLVSVCWSAWVWRNKAVWAAFNYLPVTWPMIPHPTHPCLLLLILFLISLSFRWVVGSHIHVLMMTGWNLWPSLRYFVRRPFVIGNCRRFLFNFGLFSVLGACSKWLWAIKENRPMFGKQWIQPLTNCFFIYKQ